MIDRWKERDFQISAQKRGGGEQDKDRGRGEGEWRRVG